MDIDGLNLLKHYESCRLEAYKDSSNTWTIGYGHTLNVHAGMKITQEEADRLLKKDLEVYEAFVKSCINPKVWSSLNNNKRDALTSLCYNIGTGYFKTSTVVNKVNSNPNDPTISDAFKMWNKVNGNVSKGLVNRRNDESLLYFSNLKHYSNSGPDNSNELLNYGNSENKDLIPETVTVNDDTFIKNIANAYGVSEDEAKKIISNDGRVGNVYSNLQKPAKRLLYVEPNDVNGRINGTSVSPDYTDYCIFFNLIAERVSRVTGGANGLNKKETVSISWRSQLNNDETNQVQYLKGDNIGMHDFLTNYYSDIHFNEIKEGKLVEGLGVSNVNITFESYFVPKITIKFVDVRGSGIFGNEEAVHSTDDGKISQDTLFSSFFTFPYPKFSLVVKGFYGKPVTYQLSCSDFRATFNSESGNFEADATFIGYQYSILTDIPMAFIASAPYCDYYGEKYWDEHVNSPDWAMNNGMPPVKLTELMNNISDAIETNNFMDEDNSVVSTDTYNELERNSQVLKNQKEKYDKLINDIIKRVKNSEKGNVFHDPNFNVDFICCNDKTEVVTEDDFNIFYEILDNIKKIVGDNNFERFNGNLPCKYTYGNGYNRIEKVKLSIENNNSDNSYLYTVSSEAISKELEDKKFPLIFSNEKYDIPGELMQVLPLFLFQNYGRMNSELNINNFYYCVIDNNNFSKILDEFINVSKEEKNKTYENNRKYKSIEKLLNINFKPYIGNIYKLIMCHLETFTEMIFYCADIIQSQIDNGERTPKNLGINLNKTNVPNNITNTVPPFPQVWNNGASNNNNGVIDSSYDFVGWPGDFSGGNVAEWQEEKLIRSIVNSIKRTYVNLNLDNEVDIVNNFENFPLFNFDLFTKKLNTGLILDEAHSTRNNIVNEKSALAGYLGLRVLTMIYDLKDKALKNKDFNGLKNINNLFGEMGSFEALRVYKTLGSLSKLKEYFFGCNLNETKNNFITYLHGNESINSYNFLVGDKNKPMIDDDGKYSYLTSKKDGENTLFIPFNFNKYKDIKKELSFSENGEIEIKKHKINDYAYNENYNLSKYYYDNNADVNVNFIGCIRNKDTFNLGEFNVFYDNSDLCKNFESYINNLKNNDLIIDGINFGKFETLANNLYKDSVIFNNPCALSKKYIDLLPDSDKSKEYRFPLSGNDFNDRPIMYSNMEDKKYKWRKENSFDPNKDDKKNIKRDEINLDDMVFQDFVVGIEKYGKIIEYNSLFLSNVYYKINTLDNAEARVYYKTFLLLQTLYNNNPYKLCDYNFQTFSETDLAFFGGVIFFYKKITNDIISSDVRTLYINKLTNSFAINETTDENYYTLEEMYKKIGYLNSNIEGQLIDIFKEFTSSCGSSVCEECELYFKLDGDDNQYLIKDINKFIENLKNDMNDNNTDLWDILIGKKSISIDSNNTAFVDNFVGKKRDIDLDRKQLLLDEDPENLFYTQDRLKKDYTDGVLVGCNINQNNNGIFNVDEHRAEYVTFFDSFFKKIEELIDGEIGSNEVAINEDAQTRESRDLYVPIYNYLRNMWDKWLSYSFVDRGDNKNNPFSVKNFFNNFLFIDSFYVNTFSRIHVNCEILKNIYDGSPFDATLFKFLVDIASRHHCMFYAMADFVDLGNEDGEERLMNMFKPIPYNDINIKDLRNNNHFVVMYTYPPSENLNITNNDYVYDGFDVYASNDGKHAVPAIFDNDGNYVEMFRHYDQNISGDIDLFKQRNRYGYNVPSFGVSFSRQDNNIFKNINVGMTNPVQTEQSIKALYEIVSRAQGTDRKVCFYGQDLYPVFSNMSYTCDIELLGNAQITPLMYFQLFNVPMFRGAYMIYNVSHLIQPGNMVTKIKGMKMSKRAIPYPAGWYIELEFDADGNLINTLTFDDYNEDTDNSGYVMSSGIYQPIITTSNKLTSLFHEKRTGKNGKTRYHYGVDVHAKIGTKVHAAWSGKIISVKQESGGGNTVRILHDNGFITVYMHLNKIYSNVVNRPGRMIDQGEVFAETGGLNCSKRENYIKFKGQNSEKTDEECIRDCRLVHGVSGGPHLHFELRKQRKRGDMVGEAIDPMKNGFTFGLNTDYIKSINK